jgi:hypothetical protein
MSRPEWMPQRAYQWMKLRSLGFHLLFLIVAGGCGVAATWQIHRAAQGNTLSYLYAVEWPAIAIVVGIGWWQLVHDTPEDIARRSEYHRRMRAASAEVVARTLPRSAFALTVDSEELGRRAIDAPMARAVTTGDDRSTRDLAVTDTDMDTDIVAQAILPEPEEGPSDEMTEYNRYLATLAVKGRAKTWRNPRGL